MFRTRIVAALAAGVAVLSSTVAGTGASAQPSTAATLSSSPLKLTVPTTVNAYSYQGKAEFDPGLRLSAQNAPFEIWSTRSSYADPIHSEWRDGVNAVALPEGIMTDFTGLPDFLRLRVFNADGKRVGYVSRALCLNGYSERISPDAPLRSPYPYGCPWNRFTLGSVMGIQQGFATRPDLWTRIALPDGTYTVKASIALPWRDLFGISEADGTGTFTLVVGGGVVCRGCRTSSPRLATSEPAGPAASEPTAPRSGRPADPLPDLRTLPAFSIRVTGDGDHLGFSANVWNAGPSPLVVDGFRRADEPIMDAYQYFLDANGDQVGYQLVGEMEWDARNGHHHWHFKDFARYTLLDANQVEAVRSHKEAFCLAATDAVDYTVPGADWQPDYTDLHTQCGDIDSLSIREVLSAGSGDTYTQWVAGQSFNLRGLPNGTYYVAVEANPEGKLIEASSDNNISLRQVIIGGVPGHRTVKVPRVGIV